MINIKELSDILNDENLLILDLREKGAYEAGHIPGAINVAVGAFDKADSDISSTLADKDQVEKILRSLGLEEGDKIVAYSSVQGPQLATRLVWDLENYGITDVRVLDGQFEGWKREGNEIEEGPQKKIEESTYQIKDTNEKVNVDRDYVLDIVKTNSDAIILDCRQEDEFKSKGPANEDNIRGGYIPGAINVPHSALIAKGGYFKDEEEIKNIFSDAGITGDSEVITYCQTGYRASFCWYALHRILGYDNIKIYDGSMVEWSNDEDLPVEYYED